MLYISEGSILSEDEVILCIRALCRGHQGAITIEYHAGRQSKRDNIVTERPGLREESPVFIKNSFQI